MSAPQIIRLRRPVDAAPIRVTPRARAAEAEAIYQLLRALSEEAAEDDAMLSEMAALRMNQIQYERTHPEPVALADGEVLGGA